MTVYLSIHPDDPQQRLLEQAARLLREGGIAAIPTDACYVLACHVGDKQALERLRELKGIDERHHMTLMCRDLSQIAQFARVDNGQYRLLKSATPGAYTFILEGSKELPRRVLHPKRKTLGLRIPDHKLVQHLLAELGEPLLTTTLQFSGQDVPMSEAWEIQAELEDRIALIIECGSTGINPTTVIDLTGDTPTVVREGCGPLGPLGL